MSGHECLGGSVSLQRDKSKGSEEKGVGQIDDSVLGSREPFKKRERVACMSVCGTL